MDQRDIPYAVAMWADAVPYELDTGVTFQDLVRRPHGARTLVSGTATFQPGAALPLHTHNVEEIVTVLEGEAQCEVGGHTGTLRPYDTTFVRPGVAHRFRNLSSVEVLRILWIYSQVDDSGSTVAVERNIL